MLEAIQFFVSMWNKVIAVLDRHTFDFDGYPVSLSAIFFAFIVTSLVVTIFWKGARG